MLMTGEPSWEHVDREEGREEAALADGSWANHL